MRSAVVVAALLVAVPGAAPAQDSVAAPPPPAARPVVPRSVPVWKQAWVRPLASLLVPGTGQLLGGRDRGVMYLAAELWFAARALALGSQGRTLRAQFQTLAFDVARRQFTSARVEGPWDYYESMGEWVESGAYNTSTVPGTLQPETDTLTFNGAMWLLARRNYLENPDSLPAPTDPRYQSALAFYRSRAFGDQYRWSWRDARLEMDVYREEIRASDDAYRTATNYLGALLANHLISAVDAFISVRLGAGGALPRAVPAPSAPGFFLIWSKEF